MYHHSLTNYFNAGSYEAFVIVSYKMLLIVLTFGLALMFNKRLLNDISTQEEKFSKAFHTSPYAIVLSRLADGLILEINTAFYRYTGYKPTDTIGSTSILLRLWENPNDRAFVLEELAAKRIVRDIEFIFRKKNGERLIGQYSAEIITVNNEKCLLSSINDISESKRAGVELLESEARFRNLNATKDKFFSIIAHDLKSPFNSILGFSNLLDESLKSKEYEKVEEYATIIHRSTLHTMDLLMNLLEWSRSQTGKLEYLPEYLEISLLVKEVLGLFDHSAKQKSITISMDMVEQVTIYADKLLLSTIIRNLIWNALKFTHPGGEITLSATIQGIEMIFCVRDNGIGINGNDIDKLFHIEESFSKKGTLNEQGTGLGLLLCKEFIDKHDGKIWVESVFEKGSAFFFSLPIPR